MTTATLHSATPLSHLALFRSFSAQLSERQRAALTELAAGTNPGQTEELGTESED